MRVVLISLVCVSFVFSFIGVRSNTVFSDETKPQTRENDAVKEPILKGFDKLRSDINTAFTENKLLKSKSKTWELSIESTEDQALKVYPGNAFEINRLERNKFKVELSYPWLLLRADNLADVSYKTKKREELTSYVELKSKNGEKYDNKVLNHSRYKLVASPNYAHFVGIEGSKFFFEREIGHETTSITILLRYFFSDGNQTISHEELPIIGEKKNTIHPWQVKVLPKQSSCIHSLDYSPDGKILVSALGSYNTETEKYYSEIKFWDVQDIINPVQLQVIEELDTDAQAVCFSPDGKTLAAVYGKVTDRKSKELTTAYTCEEYEIFEGEVKLWDVSDLSDIKDIFAHRADGEYQEIAAFSPDGNFLATGSDTNTIQIWDTSDLSNVKERVTLIGHKDRIASLQFSPDGKILASGSWDNTIKLISFRNLDDIREICTLEGHKGSVRSVDFSPDGSKLLTCAHVGNQNGEIKFWDVKTQKCLKTIGSFSVTYRAKFSPDSTKIAVGYGRIDGKVMIWDISDINEPEIIAARTEFKEMVWDLAFSPDGKTLAIASWDNYIKLWNIAPYDSELERILSEDAENKLSKTHFKQDDTIYNFALSPNGKYMATARSSEKITDENGFNHFVGELNIWDISGSGETKLHKKITRENESFGDYQFSRDGKYLIAKMHKLLYQKDESGCQNWSYNIEIVNVSDGSVVSQHFEDGYYGSRFCLSPDGKTMITCCSTQSESYKYQTTLRFWDVSDFENVSEIKTITIDNCNVKRLGVSPNGNYLSYLSDYTDHSVGVLDIKDIQNPKKVLQTEDGYYSFCFSLDSKILVLVLRDLHFRMNLPSDCILEFWDMNSGSRINAIHNYIGSIGEVCFTFDGKYLVTDVTSGSILLWDVSGVYDSYQLGSIKGHKDHINDMQITSDGSKLLTASSDCTIKAWSIQEIIHRLIKREHGK